MARTTWLAFNWCIEQARVSGAVEAQAATASIEDECAQWRNKALELHSQTEKLTANYRRVKDQRDEAVKENKELIDKYNERVR